jgi:hypothetical protein
MGPKARKIIHLHELLSLIQTLLTTRVSVNNNKKKRAIFSLPGLSETLHLLVVPPALGFPLTSDSCSLKNTIALHDARLLWECSSKSNTRLELKLIHLYLW